MPSTLNRVVSVFCAGTDYDENSNDVVARLYKATEGTPGAERFFYAGPGSAGAAKRHAAATAALDSAAKRLAGGAGALAHMAGLNVGSAIDTATGATMHLNVAVAEREVGAACTPGATTVNLVGWSRGAVTCIGIANALAKRGITTINLFLFDPVPGTQAVNLWNWKEHLCTLPDAVCNATVLVMENEEGGAMTVKELLLEPLRTPFAGGVATVYPMPGRHNTAVENDAVFPEVAAIGEHLATAFLIANGARLARTRLLSNAALVELYGSIKRTRRASAAAAGYTDRSFKVDNALRESLFYVNRHHKELFAAAYPTIAQILDASFNVPRWTATAATEARELGRHSQMMKAVVIAGLGSLIAQRAPMIGGTRPRRDAEDLVRLLGALNGWTEQTTQSALGAVRTPPPSPWLSPLPTHSRGPAISAGRPFR
ncbi:MAG: hypothetical protein ACXW61_05475 [Gemmatirosa sp.]